MGIVKSHSWNNFYRQSYFFLLKFPNYRSQQKQMYPRKVLLN